MELRTRIFRGIKRGLAALLVLVLLAAVVIAVMSEARLRRTYPVIVALGAPGLEHVARGRELAHSRGCADCHGDDFGGRVMVDEMPFARVVATRITRLPGESADEHHGRIYRALRHGVDIESRSLMLMPSTEYASLSAREIEQIASFLGTVENAPRQLPGSILGPLGRTLLATGQLKGFLPAETIDHNRPTIAEAPPMGSLDYGRHAAQLCAGCHGEDYAGGRMAHGGPNAPPASNLTPHPTGLGSWTVGDFLQAMRHGQRPDGSNLDGRFMPWQALGKANDQELRAIWAYLRTLPAEPVGEGSD